MRELMTNLLREDDGQNLIEYALLAALLALALAATITSVGSDLTTVYTNIQSKLAGIP